MGIEALTTSGHELLVSDALGCMAGSLLGEGRPKDAAQILGFSETRLVEIGAHRHEVDDMEVKRYITTCRKKLEANIFDQAWHTGAHMTLDEAIAFVFAEETGSA